MLVSVRSQGKMFEENHSALAPIKAHAVGIQEALLDRKFFDGFFPLCYRVERWRDVRVVEGGGLENRCPERDRGFESYSLRQED
jgi:hypothetical protein